MKKIVGMFFCMLLLATTCSAFGVTATQAGDLPEIDISITGGLGLHVVVTNVGDIPIEKFTNGCGSASGALGYTTFAGRTVLNRQFGGGAGFDIASIPVGETGTYRMFPWFHGGIAGGKVNVTVYENGDMFNENGIPNEVYGSEEFRVMILYNFFVIALTK